MSENTHLPDDPLAAERAYVEAIEETLQQLRGKPVVISPADLERVLDWFRRSVPLHLVLRTMEATGARAAEDRRWKRPRTVMYFEGAVEEAFELYQRGQVGSRRDASTTPIVTLASLLRDAAAAVERCAAPPAASSTAAHALRKLAEGRTSYGAQVDVVAGIDTELLESCRRVLSDDERWALERDVERELAPFAADMSDLALARARELAQVRLVRQRFALPDLSLLPLLGGQFPEQGG